MRSDYPYIEFLNDEIHFRDGNLISLPPEYLKPSNKELITKFYRQLVSPEKSEPSYGVDPLGFNYISIGDLCTIGVLFDIDRSSLRRNHRKKYPGNVFEKKYIIAKIRSQKELLALENYIPIAIVTQNIHELRNINSKISASIDSLLNVSDDSEWEDLFEKANENVKKIYVASRLMKFILDNIRFYIPNYIENLKVDQTRAVELHRSLSKIVKIFRNDFKKRKSNISLSGSCFKKTRGDKEIFEIILMLLVENAIKYSNDPYSISPRVIIKDCESFVQITISSFGKIIPVGEREKLFGRTFRSSVHNKIDGTGMGLHNASKLLVHFNSTLEYHTAEQDDMGWNNFIITCNNVY